MQAQAETEACRWGTAVRYGLLFRWYLVTFSAWKYCVWYLPYYAEAEAVFLIGICIGTLVLFTTGRYVCSLLREAISVVLVLLDCVILPVVTAVEAAAVIVTICFGALHLCSMFIDDRYHCGGFLISTGRLLGCLCGDITCWPSCPSLPHKPSVRCCISASVLLVYHSTFSPFIRYLVLHHFSFICTLQMYRSIASVQTLIAAVWGLEFLM